MLPSRPFLNPSPPRGLCKLFDIDKMNERMNWIKVSDNSVCIHYKVSENGKHRSIKYKYKISHQPITYLTVMSFSSARPKPMIWSTIDTYECSRPMNQV